MSIKGIVESLSFEGHGIIKAQNEKIYFVPGAWPKEEIEFEIIKEKKTYGFGKIIQIIKPSKFRLSPICKYQGNTDKNCGGCPWMSIAYEEQCIQKEKIFLNQLKKNNIFLDQNIFKGIIPSNKVSAYKNRAQIHLNKGKIGFKAYKTNNVIDINKCEILIPKLNDDISIIRKSHTKLKKVFIAEDHDVKDALNAKRPNFNQGHQFFNNYMKNWLKDHCKKISKDTSWLELFCGSGNFTKIISKDSKKIIAIDNSDSAIEKLRSSMKKIEAYTIDLSDKEKINQKFPDISDCEILLLDPPRTGCTELKSILSRPNKIEKIFSISCNPISFIKDLKIFLEHDYKIKEIILIDAYPHTAHLEVLALLEK